MTNLTGQRLSNRKLRPLKDNLFRMKWFENGGINRFVFQQAMTLLNWFGTEWFENTGINKIRISASYEQRATRTPFTPAKTISLTKTIRQTTTIHTDNHKVDYELNRSKAIKQKIEAAERPLSVGLTLRLIAMTLSMVGWIWSSTKLWPC
jgi:hypothetical protein